MAVNLTPQYLEAEAEYKKAQTAEERLACLKKMWTLVPKHKASEKLQAELKTKMSEAKEEVENERKKPKKVGVSYKIPRQGADDHVLPGALARDLVADADLLGFLALVFDLLLGLAHLGLQLGLELLAGLVLGHQRPHLLQTGQAFLGGLGLLVLGLGFEVLRREVYGHGFISVQCSV